MMYAEALMQGRPFFQLFLHSLFVASLLLMSLTRFDGPMLGILA